MTGAGELQKLQCNRCNPSTICLFFVHSYSIPLSAYSYSLLCLSLTTYSVCYIPCTLQYLPCTLQVTLISLSSLSPTPPASSTEHAGLEKPHAYHSLMHPHPYILSSLSMIYLSHAHHSHMDIFAVVGTAPCHSCSD
jgi:hypothetical protein